MLNYIEFHGDGFGRDVMFGRSEKRPYMIHDSAFSGYFSKSVALSVRIPLSNCA